MSRAGKARRGSGNRASSISFSPQPVAASPPPGLAWGPASSSPMRSTSPSSLVGESDPINYRSVNEKRMAEEILCKEGSWDPETQVFRTKQRQLQERTRAFNNLGLTLRYSPVHSYELQAQDTDFVYPNAPVQLLKHHYTPHAELSEADPTPGNIERKARQQIEVAQERKVKGVATQLAGGTGTVFGSQKEAEEVITVLEKDLRRTAEHTARPEASISTVASIRPLLQSSASKGKGTTSLSAVGVGVGGRRSPAKPSVAPPSQQAEGAIAGGGASPTGTGGRRSCPLPELKEDTSGYSSLLMQLRKTKKGVVQHHKDLSTVRSILTMDGSADLKRTITRMFADPKNAEAISAEEHDRREKLFEDERKRTVQHQTALLKEEREAMESELAQLQT